MNVYRAYIYIMVYMNVYIYLEGLHLNAYIPIYIKALYIYIHLNPPIRPHVKAIFLP